jgi:alpha-L-rhamnosidase
MNRRQFLHTASLAALAPTIAWGANPAENHPEQLARWLRVAEKLKPKLNETTVTPLKVVKPVADGAQFLRWRMETVAPAAKLGEWLLRDGDGAIIDFGGYVTGHFRFTVTPEGQGVDSPTRIKLTFGEVPAEMAGSFADYKGGLSRAWLQEEVITLDVLPATIQMPRRYAFRYVKMEVLATSPVFSVRLGGLRATALTSAGPNKSPLPGGAPELLRRIDEVSLRTLRNCMQTVFEDGPKRDRRLWIGDVRLQALANYDTFQNYDLVKRCLYLFAGLPREDGFVPACVFEQPKPARGHVYIIDYAALYAALLLDYARAAHDWKTARELWPVARRQMEILSQYVDKNGVFSAPAGSWVFIDWKDGLDRTAAMHGVFVYSLRQAQALAQAVGADREAAEYGKRIAELTAVARAQFLDSTRGVFTSGPQKQVSWATQAWMALAEIASPTEGAAALRAAQNLPDAVRPGGPYLYHYFVAAMLKCGLKTEARELVQSYWGGMVNAGADTFWEVYDPKNPMLSPYGDPMVNSYCHAWSCTPAYLLRSGGLL